MSQDTGLTAWEKAVIEHMPHLSRPQAVVLALWSCGIVMTQTCGWYWDCEKKKDEKRVTLETTASFTPLVKWVLSWWKPTEKRVALAMDATTKGRWKPHWLNLLDQMKGSIPAEWFVLVMADRGLYARWLYEGIVKLGRHPFLRINTGGTYRHQDTGSFRPFPLAAPAIGSSWCGQVACFNSNPLVCTLFACWTEGYQDPWLIVTDLLPEQAEVYLVWDADVDRM